MSLIKKIFCCFTPNPPTSTSSDNPLDSPLMQKRHSQTETTSANKAQENVITLPNPNPQFVLAESKEQYHQKEVLYDLGFVKKSLQVENAYLIKQIKHQNIHEANLYYKMALSNISQKLSHFQDSIIFYCMCVPGMNSCKRSSGFIEALAEIPLYFMVLTCETNLKPMPPWHNIRPILGNPESIRSGDERRDWIILDYGQHGPTDNLIREYSPTYNKIVPTIVDAFCKSDNVVVIFPWGVTKNQIQELHSSALAQLQDRAFNFDIQLHSFQLESSDTQLLIGYYGEGVKFKKKELKQQYPICILKLFKSLPQQQTRLYLAIDYIIGQHGQDQMLKLICQMRQIDPSPENVASNIYSKLREISAEKGVILILQPKNGSGKFINVFDLETDISTYTRKIVQRSLSRKQNIGSGQGVQDYSFRKEFYKNPRTFSRDFGEDLSSNTQSQLNESGGSL